MVIRELWHTSSEKSEIVTKNYQFNSQTKILIKTSYSMVSMGTERIVCKGMVPDEIGELMKVQNMEGSFAFPLKYGYSLVGKVIDGDKDWIGKQVHMMNPHQDFAFAAIDQVSVIPDEVPLKRAVLASLMETAVNAVWDSGISIGDTVLVNGFGLVGALVSCVVSQIPGALIIINDTAPARMQIAESMGFTLFTDGGKENFDVAFNASGAGEGLQFCIDKTGYEGTILEMSWFGSKTSELKLGANFHIRRQQIISSQVSQIPGIKLNRWDFKRRKELVFNLLKNPLFDVLLKAQVPFSMAPEIFESIRRGNNNNICITFNYL